MRFLVLGPLEVIGEGGESLPIAGAKERSILAALIAHAGKVVPVHELIEETWGDQLPKEPEKTLWSYVSRLRRALSDPAGSTRDVIVTRGDGYVLDVAGDEVDALRFEGLAEEGRTLLGAERPKDAASVLAEALHLWRGAAYQDYRSTRFGGSEGERLEELRRSSMEDRIEAKLAIGEARSLVADLEAMVRDEPLRERRWGQLMLALYRAGRQAEALQAFTRARSVLVGELGIEPGPDLQRLQTAILAQDPILEYHLPSAGTEAGGGTDVCPYKGLARFEISDAEFYFGRERIVADAIGHLVRSRFLGLVGPSGSGKSSLMRAGLLHALGSGAIPGSDRWGYAIFRPGARPLDELARAKKESDGIRSVLAIDQFEEVFTACADDAERTAFLDAITDAVLLREGAVTVVLTVRADYYGRCAEHDALGALLASDQILLGPMREEGLRRAIVLPARRAGLTIEDRLTDELVAHTKDQPGGLPLLSTALLELWTGRQDRTLRMDDYLRTGGVEGAVARLAEHAFGQLDDVEQAAAKRILLRLAEPGQGTAGVRRRAPLAEFDLDRDANAARAMAILTEARLVTVSEDAAEVGHESLLQDWPRLRSWLEDDAEGRKLHRHLTESARTWDESGRDDGDLYRGARLTSTLEWDEDHGSDTNDLEREFLDRSRTASEGEAVLARRANRRLRGLLASVAILLAISLLIGSLAIGQRDRAQSATDVADARQLAARSLTEEDVAVALLLARQAVELSDTPETRSALFAALERDPAVIGTMHPPVPVTGDDTEWIRLSPDGGTIALGGDRNAVELFDARAYRWLGSVDVGVATSAGDFGRDGRTLVVATTDRRLIGIDTTDRTIRASVPVLGDGVTDVVFEPAGGLLLTAETRHRHGFLVPRDPVDLTRRGDPVRVGDPPVVAVAFSRDSRRLVSTSLPDVKRGSGATVLWAASSLRPIRTYPVSGNDIALSPDGRTAALAGSKYAEKGRLEGHLVLLDLRTGKVRISKQRTPGDKYGHILTAVTFSPDGRSIISTDGGLLVWDAASATIEEVDRDPAGLSARAAVASPDGATAYTVDVDGNVIAWDLAGDRRVGRAFVAGSGSATWGPWFALSPDGRTLAINEATCIPTDNCKRVSAGSVRLVDTSTLHGVATVHYDRYGWGYAQGLMFSLDSRTLAVSSYSGYVQLFGVHTGQPSGPPFRAPGSSHVDFWAMPAFSPDSSILATGGPDTSNRGQVYLWDAATGRFIERLPPLHDVVNAVNFSPDGRLLVMSTGGDAIVWNVEGQAIQRTIDVDDSGVYAADVSNDGSTLVTAGYSGGIRLWDLDTGEPIGAVAFSGLATNAQTVDLSPDGHMLVAADTRGNALIWDVPTGRLLGQALPGPGHRDVLAATFSSDGRKVFVVADSGEAWVWDVDPASWEARACQVVGRDLSEAEWQLYLPDRPFDPACGG